MFQNCFCSITQECLDLPSSNLVHTFILNIRGTLYILLSLGQRSRSPGSNLPKLFKLQFRKLTSSYICATYFEITIQLYKTSVTKNNNFRGRNVLQTSLVIPRSAAFEEVLTNVIRGPDCSLFHYRNILVAFTQ